MNVSADLGILAGPGTASLEGALGAAPQPGVREGAVAEPGLGTGRPASDSSPATSSRVTNSSICFLIRAMKKICHFIMSWGQNGVCAVCALMLALSPLYTSIYVQMCMRACMGVSTHAHTYLHISVHIYKMCVIVCVYIIYLHL